MARRERNHEERPFYGPENYRRAHSFLVELKRCREHITFEQVQSLRKRALSGDVSGAETELGRMLGRIIG